MPERIDWVLRQLGASRQSHEWAMAQLVDLVREEKDRTRMVAIGTVICAG